MTPTTHAEVIALWPTKAEFARAIGTSPVNVRNMHGRIPPRHYQAVVDAADKAGFEGITYALLTDLGRDRDEAAG